MIIAISYQAVLVSPGHDSLPAAAPLASAPLCLPGVGMAGVVLVAVARLRPLHAGQQQQPAQGPGVVRAVHTVNTQTRHGVLTAGGRQPQLRLPLVKFT